MDALSLYLGSMNTDSTYLGSHIRSTRNYGSNQRKTHRQYAIKTVRLRLCGEGERVEEARQTGRVRGTARGRCGAASEGAAREASRSTIGTRALDTRAKSRAQVSAKALHIV